MSSTWKNRLSLSIFGQSHGVAIGMTLDGIPAGERIDMDKLSAFLSRRAPGKFPWSTPRKEDDFPEFLSGIVGDKTCGAPISAIIRNNNTRSSDYSEIADIPRPGHADYTAHIKYGGFQDYAGGGHFSGRLTAALCIAGGICLQILERNGIYIGAQITQIGKIHGKLSDCASTDKDELNALTKMDFPVFDPDIRKSMIDEIYKAKESGDSVGGYIKCEAIGLPAGLGEPIFDGMENRISNLVFGIPAVKGIEFGSGFLGAQMLGSENNDPFYWDDNRVMTRSNNHGGILGGITTGMPLVFSVAVKPTPSIAGEQESVSLSKTQSEKLKIMGRHDPCIVPRAVPCVEAAAAIAIYDSMLIGK